MGDEEFMVKMYLETKQCSCYLLATMKVIALLCHQETPQFDS